MQAEKLGLILVGLRKYRVPLVAEAGLVRFDEVAHRSDTNHELGYDASQVSPASILLRTWGKGKVGYQAV